MVTPGHLLIVTRRHVADFFETTADERQALFALLQLAKDLRQREHQSPVRQLQRREVAGQAIHAHIHLISRYRATRRMRGPSGVTMRYVREAAAQSQRNRGLFNTLTASPFTTTLGHLHYYC